MDLHEGDTIQCHDLEDMRGMWEALFNEGIICRTDRFYKLTVVEIRRKK